MQAKEEMFRLRQALVDLELKHDQMKEQDAKRLDPEGERAQLVASVKSDNAEVAAMELQIKEIMAQTEKINNELQEVDNVCLLFLKSIILSSLNSLHFTIFSVV